MTPSSSSSTFSISGQVSGGSHGWPFGAFLENLPAGYSEEEYFLSGTAVRYLLDARTPDGMWTTHAVDSAPFTTRLLVHRPDAASFNGTVIVEWINVSAGFELFAREESIHDGFAYVAVSAQQHGIDGYATNPQGLRAWDVERYGELSHPGDAFSYDIFSQAGLAARELFADLDVRHVVAFGMSQSGTRLMSYMNGVHQHAGVFDAFVPAVAAGMAAPFEPPGADLPPAGSPEHAALYIPVLVRTDLGVPVFELDTETEAAHHIYNRQSDTDLVVRWEIAGASHGSAVGADSLLMRRIARENVSERTYQAHAPAPEATPNLVSWAPVADTLLIQLHRWLQEGVRPTSQPPIQFNDKEMVRDERDNVLGGIRLPGIEAPVGSHHGRGPTGALGGQTKLFDADTLRTLYSSREDYVKQVRVAAENALAAGVILPKHVDDYVAAAEKQPLPGID